jgi:hypothetical protein
MEAPRGTFLNSAAVPTAYGVPHKNFSAHGLLKLAIEYPEVSSEEIRCEVITRTYDIGQPSRFKKLFGWEILAVAVNWIEGGLTPIDAFRDLSIQLTWQQLGEYTWAEAEDAGVRWNLFGTYSRVNDLPEENPTPLVIKISGKQVFKRGFFTIRFENNGSSATAPSRLDGIVLYLTNGRRMASERTA